MYEVSIVGGGASGLVLAILLARENIRVVLFEKNSRVGRRVLATGNGRCNITNINISSKKFNSQNREFLQNSILSYKEIEKFFKSVGVYFSQRVDREGRVYPISYQASSVVELLEYELKRLNVKVIYSRVEKIEKIDGKFILSNKIEPIKSKIVVVATGNIANKKVGGSADGLDFAKSLNHKITPLYPSLVQLTSNVEGIKRVAGVKIEARVSFDRVSIRGDILFAKYGVSGLAILDISPYLVKILKDKKEAILTIDFMPDISKNELFSTLKASIKTQSNRELKVWLMGFLNKKLIDFIIKIDKSKQIKNLSKSDITAVVESIKNFKLKVDGTKGFEYAEVVRGGVDTKDINSTTMESKIIKGLYFIGEVLDVDGARGGYNLHFAWSSAIIAKRGIKCSIR